MLQTMRHLAQSWLFKGLMLFLIVSFGIWGIGDIFRGNPLHRTVAKVGKMTITVEMLDHAFEQTMARARQMFGPDLTAEQARQIGLFDEALNTLIQHAGLEQDVEQLGIAVSDKDVLEKIAAQPQFRDKDGKFDRDAFHQAIERSGFAERDFLDSGAKEMAQQQLFDALESSGKVPQTIVDNVMRARGQKRVLDLVTVKDASFGDIPAPDDKTLEDFYQKNGQKFIAPEYRGITIARLATDDLAKDVTISDQDLKKEYDAKAADLAHPERRDLVQVVVQDEGKAKQLVAAARQSHDLAATAKQQGLNAVPLNQVEEKTVLPDLAKSIFALQTGQVSDPVKSGLGWHVVQVKAITLAGTPDFDSAKDQLRDNMKRDQAIENATRMVNELDDQLAAGHALEDIADGMKLRVIKIPALDAEGKAPDGKPPAELPDRAEVLKAAFAQGTGETSPVLDDRNGNYTVVRTDDITPASVPPFEKIKDRVAKEWTAAEQAKRASAAADGIAKEMRDGKPASSFAAQNGVDVRVSKPISMLGDRDADLPETVLPQAFKMKKGDVVVVPLPDSQLVMRLAELVEADPAAAPAATDRVAGEMQSQLPKELTVQYNKYLRVLFPVEVDENLLETLRQQGS